MVFLFGVAFADTQLVRRSLESFFGIGPKISQQLMATYSIHRQAKLGELGDRQVAALAEGMSELTIENELRRRIYNNVTRLRDMGTYRGKRHMFNLPVRGQKTRNQITTAKKLNRIERILAGGSR